VLHKSLIFVKINCKWKNSSYLLVVQMHYTHLKSGRKKTEAFQSSVMCKILGRKSEELRNYSKRSPNEEFYN
jgi:hypothetical protein